jgi:hypothetical protein
MKRLTVFLTLLLVVSGCGGSSSSPGVTSVPGQGAISVEVIPNPIVATQVSGNMYDFPFEVVVRETGGRSVTVQRVTATVLLGGGLELARESWDANQIRAMGHNNTLGPRSEARFTFAPRKEVPDDRLFGGVSAQLKVEATDDTGAATSATTSVTVRR